MEKDTIFFDALISGIEPPPEFSICEWADRKRKLPRVSSSESGKYRTSRTPYLREPMELLSVSSHVTEICAMKATQLGWTEIGNNWIFYVMDVEPGPMLMILPTDKLADNHVKQKLDPSMDELPEIKKRVESSSSRGSGNTLSVKQFPGGILFIAGSNTPVVYRSRTIRFLFLDDVDGFPEDVGDEGDPVSLAKKRTDTYQYRKKIFEVSTPTVKDISRIEKSYLNSDQRRYHIPCPLCGKFQALEWGGKQEKFGIKFNRDLFGEVVEAWYQCRFCHGKIEERHKTEMLDAGKWVAEKPNRKNVGYQQSSLYSPLGWVSWRQIVQEFLEAKNDLQLLKTWTNTRLGLPFEEKGDRPPWRELYNRCEPYLAMTAPAGVQIVTAGVDTQDDRLICVVRGWGPTEESWLLYYAEIPGDPEEGESFRQLDSILNFPFPQGDGYIGIISMAIDAMGHKTQAVYNWARLRYPRVMAIQGAVKKNKPILSSQPTVQDVAYMGKKIKGGVRLWTVGTHTAKQTIYSRLHVTDGTGVYHWPMGTSEEYFRQLTSEKLITKKHKGRNVKEWIKTYENHVLDCEVYAYAAAIRSGVLTLHPKGVLIPKKIITTKNIEANQIVLKRPAEFDRPNWLNR